MSLRILNDKDWIIAAIVLPGSIIFPGKTTEIIRIVCKFLLVNSKSWNSFHIDEWVSTMTFTRHMAQNYHSKIPVNGGRSTAYSE